MSVLKLDLWSSEFYFNVGTHSIRRTTFFGLFLTISAIASVLFYFLYLIHLYFSNLIDPQFRQQNFITDEKKEVPLTNDLIGFQFYYNLSTTLDQYQASQNKTYLVYIAQFYYQDTNNNIYNTIYLNTVKCSDPQLKGFICIDFTQASNYTYLLDASNSNYVYSSIQINIYGCNDLDTVKTTIPNNCAAQSDVEKLINQADAYFYLKLKTQQFNTTSKMIETKYRTIYNYVQSNQYVLNTLYTQKQDTVVYSGLWYQKQEKFSSPIQYNQITQHFDRNIGLANGLGPYSQSELLMDEIVKQFQIEYPTIIKLLTLVHAVAGLAMLTRLLGRFYSQSVTKQDFLSLFLQNIYNQKYENINLHNDQLNQKTDCPVQIPIINQSFQNKMSVFYTQNQTIDNWFKNNPIDNVEDDCMTHQKINNSFNFQINSQKPQIKEQKERQQVNIEYK
ncbi:hypothetical protein ABPG72_016782 [Tetrahymena utriculariae]